MFTGIVTDIGRVAEVEQRGDARFVIETSYVLDGIEVGASICCSGACLTVVEKVAGDPGRFAVDVSAETLSRTTLAGWRTGTRVNLERALRLGDELGGHILSGHVDGVARVAGRDPEGDSIRFLFDAPDGLHRFLAPKGSVALDGVSLTVNEVDGRRFGVNIIPHTAAATTFGALAAGDRVNLEVDMLARYVARLLETKD